MTTLETARVVTGGIDTHLDVNVAAALDPVGALLGTAAFEASPTGHRELASWLGSFGTVATVGVEGTGAYGAGIARHLHSLGVTVVEVDRPNRQERRRNGKSDTLDAVEAARAALSGRARGQAKSRDGAVEAIRVLLVARRSATRERTRSIVRMRHLGYTAPEELRGRLKGLSVRRFVEEASRLRPEASPDTVTAATKAALRSLAHRVRSLETEIAHLDEQLVPIVGACAPELLSVLGVGTLTAATLLVTAGDNPERMRSEAAWARLCGVAPLPATSGKVVSRHRLNPGGDRQANAALWRIVMVRLTCDPNTRAYVERRMKEGRSKREIIRCLKRYVAREVYRQLPRG